jgi:hypothetical protein
MHAMKAYLPPLARLLMSSLFIWDGILQPLRANDHETSESEEFSLGA